MCKTVQDVAINNVFKEGTIENPVTLVEIKTNIKRLYTNSFLS